MIAGGAETAIFQPEFTPDGRQILYVSDERGWGQLTARDLAGGQVRRLTPEGVEHAAPAWVQGMRTYAVTHDGRFLLADGNRQGFHTLLRIDLATGEQRAVECWASIAICRACKPRRPTTGWCWWPVRRRFRPG